MDLRDHLLQTLVMPQAETRFSDAYLIGETAQANRVPAPEVEEALWGLVGDGLVYLPQPGAGLWNGQLALSAFPLGHRGCHRWGWRTRIVLSFTRLTQSSPYLCG